MAVHDLRFCFQLQLAQLFTQARDGLLKLFNVKLERADLLVEALMINTDFASRIQKVLKEIRIDARKFLLWLGGPKRT